MNAELLVILESIERDKGIDRNILIEAVETALATAARKSVNASEEDAVTVTINRTTGALKVMKNGKEVSGVDFSRIAAQTAKQVIIQKIREAEREVVYSEFQGRVGDIVTGTVHRFERGDVIVELGRAEAILPRAERIPREEYQQGDRLQGYVLDVQKAVKGPSIVLSRTHEDFIRGLFVLEVPEIAEGIVKIEGIAREAGDRTKIAVSSTEDKVDSVGACVGMRGMRVKNIVRELHGEKIDIIRWSNTMSEFVEAALAPAKVSEIHEDQQKKHALVVVEDDQLSLAIGKRGQNVRLASKLTGWDIEIKSRSLIEKGALSVRSVSGVDEAMESKLKAIGVETLDQLISLDLAKLCAIPGMDEAPANDLLARAQEELRTLSEQTQAGEQIASPVTDEDSAKQE